jgi:hypothetical protein
LELVEGGYSLSTLGVVFLKKLKIRIKIKKRSLFRTRQQRWMSRGEEHDPYVTEEHMDSVGTEFQRKLGKS